MILNRLITKLGTSLLVLCLLLGSLPGTCMAEQYYQMTEEELTQSEQDLMQLKQNNIQQQIQLEKLKSDSLKLETQLIQSQDNSKRLEVQIQGSLLDTQKAKAASLQAEKSLQDSKIALSTYEKEVNSEIHKLKLERDAEAVGIVALLAKLIFFK